MGELDGFVLIPNDLRTLQTMMMRGMAVPQPMIDYDWPIRPGKTPWSVQKLQANFMVLNPGCFNLSEMRTGKTLSSLWAADYVMRKEGGKALIVGQLSTLERVWGDAIFENFLGRRTYTVLTGSAERRLRLLDRDTDFYIINYEGLNIGAGRAKGGASLSGLSAAIGRRSDIKIAIVDEASAYSDPGNLRSRVAKQLISPRKYVWLLTGTPTRSAPTDAFGIAKIVNNSFGESFRSFKLRTMSQISAFKWLPKRSAKNDVAKLLVPSIRFTQEQCFDAQDLVIMMRDAPHSTQQSKSYNELKRQLLILMEDGSTVEGVNEAALRSKLLQISCGEVYDDKHVAHHIDNQPRMSVLKEIIEESPSKVIVFAPFTSVIRSIASALHPTYDTIVVDGSVTGEARNEALRSFQDPSDPSRVLVAHPGPIARGLDLTSGSNGRMVCTHGQARGLYVQANQRINGPHQTHARTIVHLSATPGRKGNLPTTRSTRSTGGSNPKAGRRKRSVMTDNEIIEAYIKLRDMKKALKAKHTEELAPIRENMGHIESAMLAILNERGAQNSKTEVGTAFKTTRTSATVKDRDAFLNYVIDHSAWALLTNNVSKVEVEAITELTGAPPPGIDVSREIVVQFRKA